MICAGKVPSSYDRVKDTTAANAVYGDVTHRGDVDRRRYVYGTLL